MCVLSMRCVCVVCVYSCLCVVCVLRVMCVVCFVYMLYDMYMS